LSFKSCHFSIGDLRKLLGGLAKKIEKNASALRELFSILDSVLARPDSNVATGNLLLLQYDLLCTHSIVPSVALLFGNSPISPKEVFLLHFSYDREAAEQSGDVPQKVWLIPGVLYVLK
jgi:hypothetical protein